MEEEVIERRVQMRRISFILTIPQVVAKKAGIRNGQSVRFEVGDGDIVISPTGVLGDSAPDSAGPDKVERAIAEMMAKDRPKGPDARGTSPGRSKLERLRLKRTRCAFLTEVSCLPDPRTRMRGLTGTRQIEQCSREWSLCPWIAVGRRQEAE